MRGCLLLMLFCEVSIMMAFCSGETNSTPTLVENVKIVSIKLNALSTKHSLEFSSLKKDLALLKKEMRAIASGRTIENETNDIKNSFEGMAQSSFEWVHESMDELRGDLALIRGELSDVKSEFILMKSNKNETWQREKAVLEEKVQSVKKNNKIVKSFAENISKINYKLLKRVKYLEIEMKHHRELFNKEYVFHSVVMEDNEKDKDSRTKYRHVRMLKKQVTDLKRDFAKLTLENENINDQLITLHSKIDALNTPSALIDIISRLDAVEGDQKKMKLEIEKTSNEVDEVNKLHGSMLELLESMETLENRVDGVIPEFQKEFSKLEINMAQMTSHQNSLRSNHDNLRQSVKAIAVSVSNVIDKLDANREFMQKINESTNHLQNQSKLHFYRLKDHISKTEASQIENVTLKAEEITELISDVEEFKKAQHEYEDIVSHLPSSCDTMKETGVYLIGPGAGPAVQTFCENGWTLVQRRYNGSVNFNRNFKEYSDGFGDPQGEFWIGNEALNRLTKDNCSSLSIHMEDIYGKFWYASYDDFRVGPESSGYKLSIDGFKGNASNALEYQNNMEFSTIDRDRDISNTNCAANYEGGWWFSHCQHTNLNGKYTLGLTWFDSVNNEWIAISNSRMMLKKNPNCVHA